MKRQRSAPSKPSRQERRQAARDDAKARRAVDTASPLTAATSYARQDALALVALGLLVIVPYLPAMLWGGFVWDDHLYIEINVVRDVSGLWAIWFSPSAMEVEEYYWPLVYTTFYLEHKLWGFDPTGYHIVNVLLHLANTLLLWHLVRRLSMPGAWMIAAVFAVHPLHVESVAWAIERKDVLSGLFYLASALAWMRFVEQPPNDARPHVNLGATLNALGRYEEAEERLRYVVERNPQARNVHFNLGAVLYKQGRYAEALDAARVAVEQRSDHSEAHFNLGMILNALDRFKEAETHLRRAIALDPQDVDASQQLIELIFRMGKDAQDNGQPEATVEYYIGVLEIDPHHVEVLHRLASLRTDQQNYDEALELFQRLIDINPSDAVAHGNMGVVLFYLGRSDEALKSLDRALVMDPTLENVRVNRTALLKAIEGNLE